MKFTAKLIKSLPLESGSGTHGEWKKQDIIVETEDKYPKKICVSIYWDNIDKFKSALEIGNLLELRVNIESKEYNGKWYTNVKAWDIRHIILRV